MKAQTTEQIATTLEAVFCVKTYAKAHTQRHEGGDGFNYSKAKDTDGEGIQKIGFVQTQIDNPVVIGGFTREIFIEADEKYVIMMVYDNAHDIYKHVNIWTFKEFKNAGEFYTRLTAEILTRFTKREQ